MRGGMRLTRQPPNKHFRIRTLAQVSRDAKPVEPLWGDFLFMQTLTFIVGDPGVCKTTWSYALGYHLIHGLEFLGLTPTRKCNILALDYESGDTLVGKRRRALAPPDDSMIEGFYGLDQMGSDSDYYLSPVAFPMTETIPDPTSDGDVEVHITNTAELEAWADVFFVEHNIFEMEDPPAAVVKENQP